VRIKRLVVCPANPGRTELVAVCEAVTLRWCIPTGPLVSAASHSGLHALVHTGYTPMLCELDEDGEPVRAVSPARLHAGQSVLADQRLIVR
jgi:hypothetical protein